jgi:hypothetical protein
MTRQCTWIAGKGYLRVEGLRCKSMRRVAGAKAGVDEARLDVTLSVLWCAKGGGTGCGRTVGG